MTFPQLPFLLQIILLALVLTAALSDLRARRIPNWLSLVGLLAGIATNTALNGMHGLTSSLWGIGLALLVYFPLYILGGVGAGDVKLMGAIGAIVGPACWFDIFLLTAIVGGLLALALAISKGKLVHTLLNLQTLIGELSQLRSPRKTAPQLDVRNPQALRLPHGVTIALGSLAVLLIPNLP